MPLDPTYDPAGLASAIRQATPPQAGPTPDTLHNVSRALAEELEKPDASRSTARVNEVAWDLYALCEGLPEWARVRELAQAAANASR